VTSTGSLLVGRGKLIDPRRVRKVFVSPRQRATRTFQLLFGGGSGGSGGGQEGSDGGGGGREVAGVREDIFGGGEGSVLVTEEIREWDYGDYEGIKPSEVKAMRKKLGLDPEGREWSVWRDGCPNGE
jgi:broad specificity phosphatase PhoE